MISTALPAFFLLANTSDDQAFAGIMMFVLFFVCGSMVVGLAISAFICWMCSGFLSKLPPEFRRQQPGMVWLLMIPLFGIVWNFFVFPKIAESYRAYFAAQGRTDQGDCGGSLAMAYCIICCGLVIPYLNSLAALAALIVLIIMLVKFNGLKNLVTPETQGFASPPNA